MDSFSRLRSPPASNTNSARPLNNGEPVRAFASFDISCDNPDFPQIYPVRRRGTGCREWRYFLRPNGSRGPATRSRASASIQGTYTKPAAAPMAARSFGEDSTVRERQCAAQERLN
ncbi:glutathione transferase [Anopheles sinensis]|uniref:Glutathione transferase n=1 Tax=Anopheles sinensis TaxID=74873 RepID=A0A084VP63_ANOSI|nr:glutathione transferase [Anopheles sinensis]